MKATIERRKFRRTDLEAPVTIRQFGREGVVKAPIAGELKNISIAGMYCHLKAPCSLKVGEQISCSVSVPSEQARLFPFNRIVGKGWISRLEPISLGRRSGESPSQEQLFGVAVAFAQDVTVLASTEWTR